MFAKLTSRIRKFHSDEEGLEALQVVMIVAIAAMVLIAVVFVGKQIVFWMKFEGNMVVGSDLDRFDDSGVMIGTPFDP